MSMLETLHKGGDTKPAQALPYMASRLSTSVTLAAGICVHDNAGAADAEGDGKTDAEADTVPLGVREGLNGEVDGDLASCEVDVVDADAETDGDADGE